MVVLAMNVKHKPDRSFTRMELWVDINRNPINLPYSPLQGESALKDDDLAELIMKIKVIDNWGVR